MERSIQTIITLGSPPAEGGHVDNDGQPTTNVVQTMKA
jgi:hypothetical protein